MGCLINGIPKEEHLRILKEEREKLLEELEKRRNTQLENQRAEFKSEIERRLREEREKIKNEFEEKLSIDALNSANKKLDAFKEYEETIEKRVEERLQKAIDNFGKIGLNVRPILFSDATKS